MGNKPGHIKARCLDLLDQTITDGHRLLEEAYELDKPDCILYALASIKIGIHLYNEVESL